MRLTAPVLLLCIALAGCDDLSDSLGSEGAFQTLHAVPDLQAVTFYVRDRDRGGFNYLGNTALIKVGVDTYPIRFEGRVPDETQPQVLYSDAVRIDSRREYTFLLTGSAAALDLTTWERDRRSFSDDTILATDYGHAAQGFGPLDFYLEAPGANLPGANPRASLDYLGNQPDVDVAPGDYVLTITTQGEVGDVLFESETFTLTDSTNVQFAVFSGADQGTSALVVRVLGDPFTVGLRDVNSQPAVRAAHAAFNTDPVDFVIDDDFASPLLTNVAFGDVTALTSTAVTGEEVALDITPVNDPGMSLVEGTITLDFGVAYSLYYIGIPDSLSAVQVLDDNRRLAVFAKLRVFQGAANYGGVDVYVVEPEEDYRDFRPSISNVRFGSTTGYLELSPGIYDVVFTLAGQSGQIIAQLDDQNLDATGVFSFLIVDTDDVNVADIILYDDIP